MAVRSIVLRNLSVLAYANGFTLWHYKAAEGDKVLDPDFWSSVADTVRDGDHVHVSGDHGAFLFLRCKDGAVVGVGQIGSAS